MAENEAAPPRDSGGYGETKWVAERAVRVLAEAGLPAQVVRPPWLYPSSVDGSFNPDDALTRLILGSVAVGAVPDALVVEPILCIDHAVESLIELNLFENPPNSSAYLPFANVEIVEIFQIVRDLGIRLETVSVSSWREMIEHDEQNPARAILSDFGLGVGEDPNIAGLAFPSVSPIVGSRQQESESAIEAATRKMLARVTRAGA